MAVDVTGGAGASGGREPPVSDEKKQGAHAPRSPRTVVLFALDREAAPFRRAAPDVPVHVTGVGRAAAAAAVAHVLSHARPNLVIMAGFCGALRDGLAVGDVLFPAEVVDEHGGRWACAGGTGGRLLTADRLVATPAEKRALGERHAADAVDMESAAAAAACAVAGVSFRAVRAVSDAVDTELSPHLVPLLATGRVSLVRLGLTVLRRPWLVAHLGRLARDTRTAADRLAAALVRDLASLPPSSHLATDIAPGGPAGVE